MSKQLTWKQRQHLLNIADNVQGVIRTPLTGANDEDIAFVQLMRICRDYAVSRVNMGAYKNKKVLEERLDKFNIRFYEPI